MRYLIATCVVLALVVQELYAQGSRSFSMGAFTGGRRPSLRAKPKNDCMLRNDHYNPFYWKGQENICTDEICKANPLLHCNITRDYIMDQAFAHQPEDIITEIEYMEKYFHTFFPKPRNVLPYSCKGVCSMGDKDHPRDPREVSRVFADLQLPDSYTGKVAVRRSLCHIIGPQIFAHQCGGRCKMPFGFGNQGNLHCVADASVTVMAWVFCPGTWPACHKIPVTVPLSCSCQKISCAKKLPKFKPFTPRLPDLTNTPDPFAMGGGAGGDPFAMGGGGGDPFSMGGGGGDPFGMGGGDPFGMGGGDPFGMGGGDAFGMGGDPFGGSETLGPASFPGAGINLGGPGQGQGQAHGQGHGQGGVADIVHNVNKAVAHQGMKASMGAPGSANAAHVAGKIQDAFPLTGGGPPIHGSSRGKVKVH